MNDEFAHLPVLETRGRDRVRDLAEVFTAEREVEAMLDLVADSASSIEARFFEPSCGNGNFLVAILQRKLRTVFRRHKKTKPFEFNSLKALSSIYGVDIDGHNIRDARERMKMVMVDFYSTHLNTARQTEGFGNAIEYILQRNICVGDMLNGADSITFVEFSSPKINKFQQRTFRLSDMMESERFDWRGPPSIEETPMKNYWELGR
ncbi:hypothetical protein [Palleronia salina]|nr:hypothetical protein [Palleronia salina]